MKTGYKFVALSVAILMLATPVVALSACWLPMSIPSDGHHQCLMTGMNSSSATVRQATTTTCCRPLVAADVPASTVRVPETGAAEMAQTLAVSILDIPAIASREISSESPGPGSKPHPQALLCTFLI